MANLVESMGGAANAQAFGALLSLVTATIAIIIAIWNGIIIQKQARLSVIPALSIWANYPTRDSPIVRVTIANKGFGPAIIQSFQVFRDGSEIGGPLFEKTITLIKSSFGRHLSGKIYAATLERGHSLGTGDEVVIAEFSVTPELIRCGTDGVAQLMKPISLIVRYKDIYGRKWAFAVHEFDGHTFKDSCCSSSYRSARKQLGNIISSPPRHPLDEYKAR